MRLRTLTLIGLSFVLPATAVAQLVQDFRPPKSQCCLQGEALRLADQLQDWAQLGRYHDDDGQLEKQAAPPGRVVFMGDSITDGWNLSQYFKDEPYVNRGISGQTTPQMLLRMFPDVIDLHPAAMIVLAGTNDVAQNTGPETLEQVEENIQAMTELAQKHGIKVVLCSLLPVSDYTPHKQTDHRPPGQIIEFNKWLKGYAEGAGAEYVDYYAALVDDHGMLKDGYSHDGLHPNDRGYMLMAPLAEAAIGKALNR